MRPTTMTTTMMLFYALLLPLATAQNFGSGETADCSCFTEMWSGDAIPTPPTACADAFTAACDAGTYPAAVQSVICGALPAADDMNGQFMLHITRIGLMEASSAACGAPYLTTAIYMRVNSMHPLYWDTAMTAAWIFFQGNFMGLDIRTNPHVGKVFWDNDVDGKVFVKMSADDLMAMGISRGSAARFVEKRENWLAYYKWAPNEQIDPSDSTLTRRLTGDPFNISTTFILERVTTVDEINFEFECEMMVIITWEVRARAAADRSPLHTHRTDDPILTTPCPPPRDVSASTGQQDLPALRERRRRRLRSVRPVRPLLAARVSLAKCQARPAPCRHPQPLRHRRLWTHDRRRKARRRPGQRGGGGDEQAGQQLDRHAHVPGEGHLHGQSRLPLLSLRCAAGEGAPPRLLLASSHLLLSSSPPLLLSSPVRRARSPVLTLVPCTCFAQFNVTIMLPNSLPMTKARILARAEPKPSADKPGACNAGTPIWSVMCATASAGVADYNDFGTSFIMAPDDPMASWYRAVMTLPPAEMLTEWKGPAAATSDPTMAAKAMAPEHNMWGTATLTIHVKRIPRFYELNFVLIVMLLVVLSFASFLISAEALDARLGLTLTVVLGLNVFQIVVIDNTPETGCTRARRGPLSPRACVCVSLRVLCSKRTAVAPGVSLHRPDQHARLLHLLHDARRPRRARERRRLLGRQTCRHPRCVGDRVETGRRLRGQ